ncbi:MAG: AIM24 family protein [Pseudomonadota bacterium]
MTLNTDQIWKKSSASDDIDYEVFGEDLQYVEVELDPEESVIAEAGALMMKHPDIEMNTIFGDGSGQESGLMGSLLGAGKRLLTGEGLFMTVFTHKGLGKAKLSFGAPYPGRIIPVNLGEIGGELVCQKDSFLCAAKGVSVGIHLQKRIMTGLFGGEGFIMQKLEGDGWVFVHAGGVLAQKELAHGEELHVDTGCVAAFTQGVEMDIVRAGNIKSMLFGGEGAFYARLRGPGVVLVQSLPFTRLAGRVLANAKTGKGEGSILGSVGDLLDGDGRKGW